MTYLPALIMYTNSVTSGIYLAASISTRKHRGSQVAMDEIYEKIRELEAENQEREDQIKQIQTRQQDYDALKNEHRGELRRLETKVKEEVAETKLIRLQVVEEIAEAKRGIESLQRSLDNIRFRDIFKIMRFRGVSRPRGALLPNIIQFAGTDAIKLKDPELKDQQQMLNHETHQQDIVSLVRVIRTSSWFFDSIKRVSRLNCQSAEQFIQELLFVSTPVQVNIITGSTLLHCLKYQDISLR